MLFFFSVTLSSVAEVLEKQGLQKPISFVRNSQSSKEEAHQLMVRLTRHTGRKYDRHTHTHNHLNISLSTRAPLSLSVVCLETLL